MDGERSHISRSPDELLGTSAFASARLCMSCSPAPVGVRQILTPPQSDASAGRPLPHAFSTLHDQTKFEDVFGNWLVNHLKRERAVALKETEEKFKSALEDHRTSMLAKFEEMLERRQRSAPPEAARQRRVYPGPEVARRSQTEPDVGRRTPALVIESAAGTEDQVVTQSGTTSAPPSDSLGSEPGERKTTRFKALQDHHDHFTRKSTGRGTVAERIVNNTRFELFSISVIILNTILMALEVQYVGHGVGHELGVDGYESPKEEALPAADTAIMCISLLFVLYFILEFGLRVVANGVSDALRNKWMWLDFFIIIAAIVGSLDDLGLTQLLKMNPSTFRLLRLLRLARILRHAATIDSMQSLYLLIKSIKASVFALTWSVILLVVIMNLAGLFMVQMLYGYMLGDSEHDHRVRVFYYFGTYTRMMVTMFEITLGNWIIPARILMEVDEYWGTFIVIYRCMFCFAVVNVIRAVFITETQRVAANDDEVAMVRNDKMKQQMIKKLQDVFVELDRDEDGKLTKEEFSLLCQDSLMRTFVSTLEVDVKDIQTLFNLLDDGDDLVDCDEFIHGLMSMKGHARGSDVLILLAAVRRMERMLSFMVDPGPGAGTRSRIGFDLSSPLPFKLPSRSMTMRSSSRSLRV